MNEKTKSILYYCFIFILVATLGVLLFIDNRRSERIEAENTKIADQEAENRRLRTAMEDIAEQLLSSLENELKGYILWGDDQAAGSQGEKICTALVSQIEDAFLPQINEAFFDAGRTDDAYGIAIDAVNMGVSNEGLNEIMARTGAHQLVVGEDFDMPSDTMKINVPLTDEDGNTLRFAEQARSTLEEAKISGIAGRLYPGAYYDSVHFQLAFERAEGGQSFTVHAGTIVETESANPYRSYSPILFFSEYDSVTADQFIACMQEIIALYGDQTHYIVICFTKEGSEWDQALLQAFGNQYILQEKRAEDMTDGDCDALAAHIFSVLSSQGAFDAAQETVDTALEQLRQLNAGD